MSDLPADTLTTTIAQTILDIAADHPMWISDTGQPLDYLPEREARIGDFIHEAAAAVVSVLATHNEQTAADAWDQGWQAAQQTGWRWYPNRAESRADYLRDGSPEAVALVRKARGLPPLPSHDKENPMPNDNARTDAALAEVERQIVNLGDTQSRGIFDRTTLTACADLVAEMRRKCAESAR